VRIRRLPDTTGIPNELIVHRSHRIGYDQMFRAAGARFVEIGIPGGTERWEYEAAFTDRTAAVAYIDSPGVGPGALDFATVVEVAHARNVPVIVDAASTLPPISHLTRWIAAGADLAIYSGGKGIRGPQDSGLLAGRKDLIEAARANSNPRAAIARAAKVSKEAMVGLAVAIDLFMARDHQAEFAVKKEQAEVLRSGVAAMSSVACEVIADWDRFPAPVVVLRPVGGAWSPPSVRDRLIAGDPPIHVNVAHGGIDLNFHCIQPGEEQVILERFRAIIGHD
jgi:L-seryl-tRNA(Ser) seleniumtransferase